MDGLMSVNEKIQREALKNYYQKYATLTSEDISCSNIIVLILESNNDA